MVLKSLLLFLIGVLALPAILSAQPITREESAAIDSIHARHARNHKPKTYLFRNVTLLTMRDSILLPGQDVRVKEGRIEKIGPNLDPIGASLIDGTGQYLMPGLADMHVHLFQNHPMKNTWLLLLLLNGVITVRDMCGEAGKLGLREQLWKNEVLGPTLYQAGPILDGVKDRAGLFAYAATPDQGRAFVAAQFKAGYDLIKVYDGLSEPTYAAILDEAKRLAVPVAGHVPKSLSASEAVTMGQGSVEHMTGYYKWKGAQVDTAEAGEAIRTTVRREVWNCPTLYNHWVNGSRPGAAAVIMDPEVMQLLPKGLKKDWSKRLERKSKAVAELTDKNRAANFAALQGVARRLHEADGRLLAGTDAGNLPFMVPGFSLHEELKQLEALGMSPYKVLKTATVNAAQALMSGGKFGRVEEGQQANLLLLGANPLAGLDNLKKKTGVMVRGIWFSESDLEKVRAEVAKAFAE